MPRLCWRISTKFHPRLQRSLSDHGTDVFGSQAYASVNGFIYFIRGVGALWGPPAGGLLLRSQSKKEVFQGYANLIWYNFALFLFATTCTVAVRGFDAMEKKVLSGKHDATQLRN
jgi:hypothetical protein